jgi:hypothetical protein
MKPLTKRSRGDDENDGDDNNPKPVFFQVTTTAQDPADKSVATKAPAECSTSSTEVQCKSDDHNDDDDIACVGDKAKFILRFSRKDVARRGLDAMLKVSKAYRVPRTVGNGMWIALVLEDEMTYARWDDMPEWPRVYGGGEAQLVSGAVFTDAERPILTAVYTYSSTADETSLFYTKEGEDAEFFKAVRHQVAEQGCTFAEDALFPSSGDYEVEALQCPSLQLVTSLAQFTFGGKASYRRWVPHEKGGCVRASIYYPKIWGQLCSCKVMSKACVCVFCRT